MPPSVRTYADRLFLDYDLYRLESFPLRRFPPEMFHSTVDMIMKTSPERLRVRTIGHSFEGRPLRLVSAGDGKISVLLWSQMHGDESTATMAIADILNYFTKAQDSEITRLLFSQLSMHFLPILNPDGATRFQRRTAQHIDMNRDAIALCTPEARILTQIQRELLPEFGFNLHDQELSTVGTSKELSAIALLAPAFDEKKSENQVRTRAKQVAAMFASIMHSRVSGNMTRYDDSFEPRAFGDSMQKWGTSTLLVESGHTLGDPEKLFIRKLNFVGILASLYGIASGEYKTFDIMTYESLPGNSKKAYNLIIRNVLIEHGGGPSSRADLGISYQVDTHTESTPVLVDIGDLHTYIGLTEINGNGKVLPSRLLTLGKPFEWKSYINP